PGRSNWRWSRCTWPGGSARTTRAEERSTPDDTAIPLRSLARWPGPARATGGLARSAGPARSRRAGRRFAPLGAGRAAAHRHEGDHRARRPDQTALAAPQPAAAPAPAGRDPERGAPTAGPGPGAGTAGAGR